MTTAQPQCITPLIQNEIMKKAYIAPSTTLYEVKTGNMLALSADDNVRITKDNANEFEVYSGRANESIWSDNSSKSGIWK